MWRMRRSRHLDRYALPLCCSLPGVVFLLSLSMYITSLHTAKCKRLPLMIKQLIASVQKMPPRQMFPGGTVPIMLTFRFVTTCQAQSICALEKSKCSCREKIRQLWISPPVCYNNALTSFASSPWKETTFFTWEMKGKQQHPERRGLWCFKDSSSTTSCLHFCWSFVLNLLGTPGKSHEFLSFH